MRSIKLSSLISICVKAFADAILTSTRTSFFILSIRGITAFSSPILPNIAAAIVLIRQYSSLSRARSNNTPFFPIFSKPISSKSRTAYSLTTLSIEFEFFSIPKIVFIFFSSLNFISKTFITLEI